MLTAIALSILVALQAPADEFLSRLAGTWRGEGRVLDQPARVTLEWSWTLGGRFIRLTFVNDMGPAGKTTRFEGHAYYRVLGGGRSTATWFDNAGLTRPITARREADAMVSEWGTPETEVGETTYRLLSANRLEIVDRVRSKDGQWREFGRTTVVRD
jgi:hypothetical protein